MVSPPTRPFLPWIWALEALANVDQVDPSLLRALIRKMPGIVATAPETVKERLALRVLEGAVAASGGDEVAPPTPRCLVEAANVDRSAEEALCSHLKTVTNFSSTDMSPHEILNHDVQRFIFQRRDSLSCPSLELLGKSIREGFPEVLSSVKNCDLSIETDNKHLKCYSDDIPLAECCGPNMEGSGVASGSGDLADLHHEGQHDDGGFVEHPMKNGDANDAFSFMEQELRTLDEEKQNMKNNQSCVPNAVPVRSDRDLVDNHCRSQDNCQRLVETQNQDPLSDVPQDLKSSQVQFSDKFDSGTWTNEGLCIKCFRSGSLLCCQRSGCAVTVHEGCLGSPPRFAKTGEFYCPLCAYARARRGYCKAKRNFIQANKNVIAFIGKCMVERLSKKKSGSRKVKQGSRESPQMNDPPLDQEEGCDKDVEGLYGGQTKEHEPGKGALLCGNSNGSSVDVILTQEINAQVCMAELHPGQEKDSGSHQMEVDDQSCEKQPEGQTANLSWGPGIHSNVPHVEIRSALPRSLRACRRSSSENADAGNTYNVRETTQKRKRVKSAALKSQTYEHRIIKVLHEGERPTKRTKLPWTMEEEEALKEGVRVFAANSDRKIPWRKILEFYRHLFQGSRLPIDLKEKWRRICKQ